MRFGKGINSYHKFLWHLFCLFILIIVINSPSMYIYSSYGFYDKLDHSHSFEKYTLGNMGYSETKNEITKPLDIMNENRISINITC